MKKRLFFDLFLKTRAKFCWYFGRNVFIKSFWFLLTFIQMNFFLAGFCHLEPLCSRSGVNSERPPRKLHRGASEAIMAFVGAGSLDGLRLHFAVVSSPHSQEYCSRYHRLGLSQRRTAQTHCKSWLIFSLLIFDSDFWLRFHIVKLGMIFFSSWAYFQVPNKKVGPNKRVGWSFWANFINK